MKRLVSILLYRTGLLSLWHAFRNRRTLTVVLFHRVLPYDVSGPASQQPEWAVTPEIFERSLLFFQRHYNVVSLAQVSAAVNRGIPLPPRALLVTFDDGYLDNLVHAVPVLRRHALPAVLFAVAGDFDGLELWQEAVLRGWRRGALQPAHCSALWNRAPGAEAPPDTWPARTIAQLLARLDRLPPEARDRALADSGAIIPPREQNYLMSAAQLREWAEAGLDIGSHGTSHHPLIFVPDPSAELRHSRDRLTAALKPENIEITAISWPHGLFNEGVAVAAREAGFSCLFSTNPVLNIAPGGRPSMHLGRYEPGMATDPAGRFRADLLARKLFLLPRGFLSVPKETARVRSPSSV